MDYKINLLLQQGDTTGNNPVIDVLWNGNIVISSHTITTALNTNGIGDELSFITSDFNSQNNLEIVYKNKPSNDSTDEIKVSIFGIISSSASPDLWWNNNISEKGEPQGYFYINPNIWTWTSATVDGNEISCDFENFSNLNEVCWPLEIKNSSASMVVNYPGNILSSTSTPLLEIDSSYGTDNSSYNFVESKVRVN